MPFKMTCPKCGSHSFSVSRERNGFGLSDGELVAACTCGKRLYGKQVEAEHEAQLAVWKKEQRENPPTPTPPPADRGAHERSWVARYVELAQETLPELEAEVREAVGHRVRVDNLWTTLGLPHKDDEAGRKRNLINLEVVIVKRLLEESHQLVQDLRRTTRGDLAQRHHKGLMAKGEEIQSRTARIPFYADQACEAAKEHASLTPTTPCAHPACKSNAVEGRKYCGDECRKRLARDRYTARQQAQVRVAAPKPTPKPTPKPAVNGYDAMGKTELMAANLQLLRKYARNNLGIIGASKIRGGKPALVSRILEVRG